MYVHAAHALLVRFSCNRAQNDRLSMGLPAHMVVTGVRCLHRSRHGHQEAKSVVFGPATHGCGVGPTKGPPHDAAATAPSVNRCHTLNASRCTVQGCQHGVDEQGVSIQLARVRAHANVPKDRSRLGPRAPHDGVAWYLCLFIFLYSGQRGPPRFTHFLMRLVFCFTLILVTNPDDIPCRAR
jgi:hypothetical protein